MKLVIAIALLCLSKLVVGEGEGATDQGGQWDFVDGQWVFIPGKEGTPRPVNRTDANCPVACPAGWNTWGPLTDHCYLMPAQPVVTDTFWNNVAFCKASEPTSYPLVINDLAEQLVGSAVVLQYAPSYLEQLTNIFAWFGGYATPEGWVWMDGTEQKDNVLMTLVHFIGSKENGTCLGAEAKTLGVWQTRPCSDKTGAPICEMAKRRVCGATGGMLPISPIKLDENSIKALFPKAPSLPFLDITKVGSTIFGGGANGVIAPLTGGGGNPLDKLPIGGGVTGLPVTLPGKLPLPFGGLGRK
jgi:hypothetical protein